MQRAKIVDFTNEITQREFLRLEESVNKILVEVEHISVSQKYMEEDLKKVNTNINTILERNIRQDTVLSLIHKIWKLSPYIISIIFIMVLGTSETSFDFSRFMTAFLSKYLGN